MIAFVEHEVPQGLGKKSMVIIPASDGCLVLSVPYDGDHVWFGDITLDTAWNQANPKPKDGLEDIILPDYLACQLLTNFKDRKIIAEETVNHLRELVIRHRG